MPEEVVEASLYTVFKRVQSHAARNETAQGWQKATHLVGQLPSHIDDNDNNYYCCMQ
jgi:hypothetical protein